MNRKRTLFNMCSSFLAMVVCSIMLSEMVEDIRDDTNNMDVPPTTKPFLAVGLAILVGVEGEKVRHDLERLAGAR